MMVQNSYDGKATFYIVPTPIGNLDDMTYRAVATLKMVDIIFCEDTRITKLLLDKFDIHKKLICCNDINEEAVKSEVIKYLSNGLNVGFVSDRGTPLVSDPGFKSVVEVVKNNYNVVCLPGATAFVPAIVCSGIYPIPFIFYGFLNSKKNARDKELMKLKNIEYTLIFYEAPHRLIKTLESLKEQFGNRNISIVRELSKLHEEVFRGDMVTAISYFENGVKGELVLVVEGNKDVSKYNDMSIKEHVDLYIKTGDSVMDAIKIVAKERNMRKSDVYNEYHNL